MVITQQDPAKCSGGKHDVQNAYGQPGDEVQRLLETTQAQLFMLEDADEKGIECRAHGGLGGVNRPE